MIGLALLACEMPPPTFADVLPGQNLILPEEELVARGLPEEPATWATWLLDEARAANRRHTELVLLVEAVTLLPANYRDPRDESAVVWGPWIVDDEAERLWVEDRGSRGFAWGIEHQIVDPDRVRFDDEGWITDLTGTIGSDDDGGEFLLNVDEVGFGAIDTALEAFGEGATSDPYVQEFVDDEPVGWAGLRYSTAGALELTSFPDLAAGAEVPETGGVTFVPARGPGGEARAVRDGLEITVRWTGDGSGRADVISRATGGVTVECWGPDHERTFATGSGGDPSACPLPSLP